MPDVHLRRQLFDRVKQLLVAIDGFDTPGKVARGRTSPVRQETLPAITLTWADNDESLERRQTVVLAEIADGYDRSLDISIILHLRDTDPETAFDDHCLAIEHAMAADPTLNDLAVDCTLVSQRLFVDNKTGISLACGRLVYRIQYLTASANVAAVAL